jgi:hypothetical protein
VRKSRLTAYSGEVNRVVSRASLIGHVIARRDRSAKPEDLAGAVWQGLVSADSVGAKKRRQCCRGGGVRPGQPAWERA